MRESQRIMAGITTPVKPGMELIVVNMYTCAIKTASLLWVSRKIVKIMPLGRTQPTNSHHARKVYDGCNYVECDHDVDDLSYALSRSELEEGQTETKPQWTKRDAVEHVEHTDELCISQISSLHQNSPLPHL